MNRISILAGVAWSLGLFACTSANNADGRTGGSAGVGGSQAGRASSVTGGTPTAGGSATTGGTVSNGGVPLAGGTGAGSGTTATGGASSNGGSGADAAGAPSDGPSSAGGTAGTGDGAPNDGAPGTGGSTDGNATANDGTAASGGATGTDGGSSTAVKCTAEYTGSDSRPLLTDDSAACFTVQNYLAQAGLLTALVRDNWDPSAGLPATSSYTPTYTVAVDGSGTHTTVQAAITAASSAGGNSRVYILIKPGTYRELVCVKSSVPITLYGADTDATKVTIAFDNYNGKTVDSSKTNACAVPSGATYGTSGSSTFFVSAAEFQAQNLTIANDFVEGGLTTNIQAVALTVQGDQQVFQNVRLIGNQDTLQVKSSAATTMARSYFKNSYIEGDTDFIFGRGTAVFDACTINYLSGRKTNGTQIAPSTEMPNSFGFLIINSKIVGDSGAPADSAYLGRAWDDSSGAAPNGQAVVRNTEIGSHIKVAAPWAAAASSSRVFSASGNRLYEYNNTGPGAAPGPVSLDGGSPD